MLTCTVCGQQNPDDARFCNFCGSPLRAGQRTLAEERKTVTVVFVDLVGFTAQAEQLDPEDVRGVLAPYHAHLREELERHGGTVEKFIGDAVMAVFGAPVSHDDDPERAVRAALAIRDWSAAQTDLQVRVAVHTGETLVNIGARAAEGEALVSGDVVNTAARLQTAAPVNGVLAGEITYRATRDAIRYRAAPAVQAKGKADPVAAWEALEPVARSGVDIAATPLTPLVGRERELEQLRSVFRRVRDDHATHLLTILGVPGIGKSRLVRELYQAVDGETDLITWRQGRCPSYGEGVTFWALGEIVKAEAGIMDSDAPARAAERVRAAVTRLAPDPGEARWLETGLRVLVTAGDDDTGTADAETAAAAWRRFLEAMAEQGPAVVVFEDLHWADDRLLDFVDDLVDAVRDVPLLVVVTARPELLERRPAWAGGKANATTVSLQRLAEEDAARLIAALLAGSAGEPDDRQALLERAGGNPLFAEQYVRMLAERGTTGVLPESVQGVITARLDALPRSEKELIQEAAVHGKMFWLGGVAATLEVDPAAAEPLLRSLERKDFVRRERRTTIRGDTQYAFQHVLLRDVAYGQIPRRTRAEKHRRAGDWIESLARPQDHAELLAHHYTEALALSRAAGLADDGTLVEQACASLRAAGERAAALNAHGAAAAFFADALTLTATDDPARPRLLLARAQALVASAGGMLEPVLEALTALEATADTEGQAEAAALAARVSWQAGDAAATDRFLTGALEITADAGSSLARATTLTTQCGFLMLRGDFERAIAVGAEAQPLVDALGLEEHRVRLDNFVGCARCCLGDEGGLAQIERSIALAQALGALVQETTGYGNLGSELWFFGRLAESRAAAREALELARRHMLTRLLRSYRAESANWAYLDGRWDDAVIVAAELIGRADSGEPHYSDATLLALRAFIELARGDTAGAARDGDRAVALARASDLQAQAQAYTVGGLVALADGRRQAAAELASELAAIGHRFVPALCTPFPTLAEVAWLFHDLGRAAELARTVLDPDPIGGPWSEAARAICDGDPARAAAIIDRIGHPAAAAYARLRAAAALTAAGREAEAASHRARAEAFYRPLGAVGLLGAG